MNFYRYNETAVFNLIGQIYSLPITNSGFDSQIGHSWVKISTPDGDFLGESMVHPDDFKEQRYTSLTGQLIAHYRAMIKYLKYMKRIFNHTYDTLNQVWSESKKYNATSDNLKAAMFEISDKINLCKSAIDYLEQSIKKKIEGSEKYYNKVKNK